MSSRAASSASRPERVTVGFLLEYAAEAGMRAKSEEFAASGNRVYLPLTD